MLLLSFHGGDISYPKPHHHAEVLRRLEMAQFIAKTEKHPLIFSSYHIRQIFLPKPDQLRRSRQ